MATAPHPASTREPVQGLSAYGPVFFDYDRADLTGAALEQLGRIGAWMLRNPHVRVLLEGHCDERGSAEYNIGLGQLRAATVARWLETYGVDPRRLSETSWGKERPTRTGCDDEYCHQVNRRVEFSEK